MMGVLLSCCLLKLTFFHFIFTNFIISCTCNSCTSLLKCGECIRTAGCVWCKDPKFTLPQNVNSNYARCNTIQEHLRLGVCELEYLEDPTHSFEIKEFENRNSHEESSRFQLVPNIVNLNLRVGHIVNISMEYHDTLDKPLDLYYVMDLSATMADDKPKVATLGTSLVKKIQNLTSNVKIGFGSFIDKPIEPFVSVAQLNKEETNTTTPPYSFKNHLSLTHDVDKFQEEVRKSKTSGNLEPPEGVLEAVMQAVVCKDVIGWRPRARHLLIVSTDGPFHIAGDAKLAGIVKPNDGKCYMTKGGNKYTASTTQDYPSIAQINNIVKKENVFVIFAVTEENVNLYTKLSSRIQGSATRALKEDSDNVVDLVEEEYKKIITSIELPKLPPQISKYVKLNYYAKCSDDSSSYVKNNKCQNMKVGSNANFQIEIEVIKCPKNIKDWKQSIVISPIGTSDRMIINLEFLCECPCASKIDKGYVENDKLCEYKGTPRCGVCDCTDGYLGKNCQCTTGDKNLLEIDESGCKKTKNSSICSGRGSCICGQCICNQNSNGENVYSGNYCECNDGNCPIGDNGMMCSGNGVCKCSNCVCNNGFLGESCSCPTNQDLCREPGEDSTCSSRGYCRCGRCVCESPFTGHLCQNCPNCPGKCEDSILNACLRCYIEKIHSNINQSCVECEYLSKIQDVEEVFEETDEEKSCFFVDENSCETKYVYSLAHHDWNKLQVRVARNLHCQPEMPILWIILGISGSVLIGGLILLMCWKFVIYYHDLKEWEKFKKEIKNLKWDSRINPLYKDAISTFNNPSYRNPVRT